MAPLTKKLKSDQIMVRYMVDIRWKKQQVQIDIRLNQREGYTEDWK